MTLDQEMFPHSEFSLHSNGSREDVLHNLGIARRSFSEQNKALVTELTRRFLDYSKSARLEAANAEEIVEGQCNKPPLQ